MNFIKSLLVTCGYRCVGLFYSSVLLLKMLFDTAKCGTKVWEKKNRRKALPPSIYRSWSPPGQESSIQWKHGYIMARGLRFHYVTTGELPKHVKLNDIDGETTITNATSSLRRPKLILCLHGFPESWFSWRYVLKHFDDCPKLKNNNGDETSYFVVAMDMRGFGNSDHPPGIASYNRDQLGADVKAIIKSFGYEKAILLSHDWGGVVSWHVVEYFPEIIEKLIVLNCPHPQAGLDFALSSLKQLLVNSWYMHVFTIPIFPEAFIRFNDYEFLEMVMTDEKAGIQSKNYALDKEELDLVKYMFEGDATTSGINYYRALLLPFYQPKRRNLEKHKSTQARFPILLLWGDRDVFMDKKMAEMTKPFLPSTTPPSRVVIIDGAGHWLQQDKPSEVIKFITEFLAE